MTNPPKRLRERREKADLFFDQVFAKAAADPEFAHKAGELIGPRHIDPLPGWAEPTPRMKPVTDRVVTRAWHAVQRAVDVLRLPGVYTGFRNYPVARFDFSEGNAPDFAPLLAFCLDGVIYAGLARVVAHAHSRQTRPTERTVDSDTVGVDLYPGDDGLALMERTNVFLETEARLWELARDDGGFQGSVPYPVRYESARYLWSPRIAGVAFCLRCGAVIRYRRAGRTSGRRRRVPLCGPCIRGGSLSWPERTVMPDAKGKWWLMCQQPGCTTAFVGAGQARFCEDHRSARLTKSKRTRARPGRALA